MEAATDVQHRVIENLLDQVDVLRRDNAQLQAQLRQSDRDGDCCPAASLPALTPREHYIPRGEVLEADGLPMYVVGDADRANGRAVIVSYDIYGFHGGRIRAVCDEIADAGYLVALPDFFRGDAWSQERTECEPDAKAGWIKSVSDPKSVTDDLAQRVMPYLASRGATRIGVVGFCFGGYVAFLASKLSESASAVPVRCGVGVHSSIKCFKFHGSNEVVEAEKVRCPQMLLQAGNDPENTKPGGAVHQALKQRLGFGPKCVVEEFPDMKHGWLPRGDLSQPAVCRDVAAAMKKVLAFLHQHLSK